MSIEEQEENSFQNEKPLDAPLHEAQKTMVDAMPADNIPEIKPEPISEFYGEGHMPETVSENVKPVAHDTVQFENADTKKERVKEENNYKAPDAETAELELGDNLDKTRRERSSSSFEAPRGNAESEINNSVPQPQFSAPAAPALSEEDKQRAIQAELEKGSRDDIEAYMGKMQKLQNLQTRQEEIPKKIARGAKNAAIIGGGTAIVASLAAYFFSGRTNMGKLGRVFSASGAVLVGAAGAGLISLRAFLKPVNDESTKLVAETQKTVGETAELEEKLNGEFVRLNEKYNGPDAVIQEVPTHEELTPGFTEKVKHQKKPHEHKPREESFVDQHKHEAAKAAMQELSL